jgi:hypothetical protein
MRVHLKGIASATKRLADGSKVVYYCAWRGGLRLNGEPGTPDSGRQVLPTGPARADQRQNADHPEAGIPC